MLRAATLDDVEQALDMAEAKRQLYAAWQPIFHRPAAGARDAQAPYFRHLISSENILTLVHDADGGIDGFITAVTVAQTPPTLSVDDFVIKEPALWPTVGRVLLDGVLDDLRSRGGGYITVNCGPLDEPKRSMLAGAGLRALLHNMVNHDPLPELAQAAPRPRPAMDEIQAATEDDVDRCLDLVIEQGELCHLLAPTHWQSPPNRQKERDRLLRSVGDETSICLTGARRAVDERGILIADLAPRVPVYDPGGPIFFIPDLAVAPGAWERTGVALLVNAMDRMIERGAAMMNTFAFPDDVARTDALRQAGLTVVTEYFSASL